MIFKGYCDCNLYLFTYRISPSDTESANGGTSTISSRAPDVRKNRTVLMDHEDGVLYLEDREEELVSDFVIS